MAVMRDFAHHVHVALPLGERFGRDTLTGILEACHAGQWGWWISSPLWIDAEPVDMPHARPAGGVIGVFWSAAQARAWSGSTVRLVNVAGCDTEPPGVHTVTTDHPAVGRVAAAHLLERGYRSFAVLSVSPAPALRQREAGFRSAVEAGGAVRGLWTTEGRRLADFLADLPPDTGIFCTTDAMARYAVASLLLLGRRVPEDAAVVGVDDDPLHRSLSPVPLSSVDIRFRAVGELAARTLHGLLNGEPRPTRQVLPPGEVIVRRSSDFYAVDDPKVVDLLRRIRARATAGVRVADVLKRSDGARRTVELKFRRYLGRSIEDEIRRCRLEAARELLVGTSLSSEEVAHRCGFANAPHLSRLFKAHYGLGPKQYRTLYREN